MKTRQIIALILCTAISFLTVKSASANSAPKGWSGVDASGATVSGAGCPITVESELLTFNVPDFPDYYDNAEYSANVTAKYTFYNPASYTVTAKLAFPFGKSPDYNTKEDVDKYDIFVNDRAVGKAMRHTLSSYSFNLENDLPLIADEYKKDRFYRPDLPVTKYTVEIIDYDKSYKNAGIGFDFSFNYNNKVIMSYNSDTPISGGHRLGVHIGSDRFITFYIMGEQVLPKYRFYEDGGCETGEEISGEAKIVSTEEITFEELVFMEYREDSAILKTDWYNAVIDNLNKYYLNTVSLSAFNVNHRLMRWYEYEITFAPKERIVNTVTAPIYPDIDGNFSPYVYRYIYLLSPAKAWADFKTLDIVINTPFYLVNNEKFEKNDTGYRLSLDGLPDGELVFTLSASENPKRAFDFWDFISAALMFAPAIFLVTIILTGIIAAAAVTWKKRR